MAELDKAYDPKKVEEKWSQFWEQGGFFKADAKSTKPAYSISIPPPNVTGVLHMGHALGDTLQDVLIRWKRMSGYEALWVPGTDHAGIATQTVVEKQLIAKTGKRRKEFSREEFLSHVWAWKETSENQILSQIKRLGCSCDWSRLAFTMDEKRNLAVRTMFKKMFDDGLIYRGDYLVNWDPITQTALADDEVEYEERTTSLWYIRYPVEGSRESIIIATTRPETMLGDVAVAVSPSDHRYSSLIGSTLILPLMGRRIPVVADHHVDPTFGTGVVKITPAHDPNDYEIAHRHNLPLINILTPDGHINENGGEFQGLPKEEAREIIVQKLKELKLLERVEPYKHRVGLSYRSKAIIEPYLSKQWFVRMAPFKEKLISAVKEGRVKLLPAHWDHTYFHWIENLRDWCISRQLWWGHRIPIWYKKANPEEMICYAGTDLPPEVKKAPEEWAQDEDVLDTWFSSALWPFSILGWPEKTPDLEKFYPNSTLVTGHDILFFWAARMILMGEYALDEPPFTETFIHGLIYGKSYWKYQKDGSTSFVTGKERDGYDLGQPTPPEVHSKWEKMSKSKGNVIDPIEIIDSYGTDAMRMALCASATHARQIDLDRRRFEEFKNFTNKVWNGARFVLMNVEDLTPDAFAKGLDSALFTLEDRWILSLLNKITQEVEGHLEGYAFDKAATCAYDFFWKEFCAYYVELVKPFLFGKVGTPDVRVNKQRVLVTILCHMVRLLHPMAPFVTEELFQILKERFSSDAPLTHEPYVKAASEALRTAACAVASYPKLVRASDIDAEIERRFALMDSIVHAVRNIRAEMQLPPGTATDLILIGSSNDPEFKIVKENQMLVQSLVRIQNMQFETEETPLSFSASAVVGSIKLVIPLPAEMREKELIRLTKEQEKLIQQQNKTREQLANPQFVQRAPAELVEKLKAAIVQADKELAEVMSKLKKFST
ncbi:MAG: valine--tRNA ligase [Chlamydiales bacterium]|nr:valine--tRNA ligase [Chlamydiales bacterium]